MNQVPDRRWGGIGLRILGSLLLLTGVGFGAMTERALMAHQVAAARHGDAGDEGDAGTGESSPPARMVRVAGTPEMSEPARDPEFHLAVSTPMLLRRVEMFQWHELSFGGDVHYELDWIDHPVDATDFRRPPGHVNPGEFPIKGKQFDATGVSLGGYRLGPRLVHALPGNQSVTPDLKQLPANLAASFSLYQGSLVTSANPADPRLGDVRVSWEAVPLQQITVFARLEGDRLVPATGVKAGTGFDIQIGDRTLADLLPDVPLPPEFVQLRRLLAMLLATLGVGVLLWEQRRRDLLLGMALGVALVASVAGVLWLAGDMRQGLEWLGVAAAGIALAIWRARRRL